MSSKRLGPAGALSGLLLTRSRERRGALFMMAGKCHSFEDQVFVVEWHDANNDVSHRLCSATLTTVLSYGSVCLHDVALVVQGAQALLNPLKKCRPL